MPYRVPVKPRDLPELRRHDSEDPEKIAPAVIAGFAVAVLVVVLGWFCLGSALLGACYLLFEC